MAITSDAYVVAGRYQLGDPLGRGGMGEVRRARDLRLNRDVAVKLLKRELSAQPDARRRFEHEAQNAARLNHPNVVAVLDCGEHEGQPFLVMECLPGRTLRDELGEGPLSQARATWIGRDVLSALAAAHAVGVVHRDVTPANILLTDEGRAKLADFGIAKAAEADSLTTAGLVIGTPAYIAPERLRGEDASPASDIYGLGATLNAAVGARTAELDRNFAALVDRMMDPDPARRPTAESALERLTGAGAAEPETTVLAAVGSEQPTMIGQALRAPSFTTWRDRSVILAIAAVAAVLGIAMLIAALRGGEDATPLDTNQTNESIPPTTAATIVPSTFAPVPSIQVRVGNAERDDAADREKKPRGKGKAKDD